MSERIAFDADRSGQVPAAELVAFLDTMYPGSGARCYETRAKRHANIASVRPRSAGEFRKAPGEPPIASGPPSPAHLAGAGT